MVTVFFRYDDYSSMSPAHVDTGLIEVFARHSMTCTFAVVPSITSLYPQVQGEGQDVLLTEAKINELKEAVRKGAVDVALHGWNHLTNAFSPPPVPSEFRGLSVEQQTAILLRGKRHLGDALGVEPTVFVPPWNTYDDATLEALTRAGFNGLSANRYSPISHQGEGLGYAPMTIEIGALRRAVDVAAASQDSDPVVGVMLHPYDFHESGDNRSVMSLADFEKELVWLAGQKGVRVLSISALIASSPDMNAKRFAANKPSVLETVFPGFIPKVFSDPVYRSAAAALRLQSGRHLQLLVFLLLVALAGGVGGSLISLALADVSGVLLGAVLLGILLVTGFLIVRAIRLKEIYSRALTLITVLCGTCFGLVLAW